MVDVRRRLHEVLLDGYLLLTLPVGVLLYRLLLHVEELLLILILVLVVVPLVHLLLLLVLLLYRWVLLLDLAVACRLVSRSLERLVILWLLLLSLCGDGDELGYRLELAELPVLFVLRLQLMIHPLAIN